MIQDARTTTTTALLKGLYDSSNSDVWREFDTRYRPILVAFAKKIGLNEDDAAETAQESLTQFVQDYQAGKYDRQRGRLRAWLIGIVKHRVADLKRRRVSRRERRGESAFIDLSDPVHLSDLWEAERRKSILEQAVAELRDHTRLNEKTIRAFELYALQQRPVLVVAHDLGITPHDVYMAKNRVAERLREVLARLETLFDDG